MFTLMRVMTVLHIDLRKVRAKYKNEEKCQEARYQGLKAYERIYSR